MVLSNAIYLEFILIPSKRLNSSIWFIDEILTGIKTLGQNGPKSNGHEGVFIFPKL